MTRKIVTWAVAALFAVPAIPMFARTVHAHKLTHTSKVHVKALSSSTKHRTTHHHKKHHTPLTSTKKGHKTLVSSAHAGRHLTHSTRHVAKAASSIRPQVLVHNQPTIDGMHT